MDSHSMLDKENPETRVYNGYGNPYWQYGGKGIRSRYAEQYDKLEDEILYHAIPYLDKLSMDLVVEVSVHVCTGGVPRLFDEYFNQRKDDQLVGQEDARRYVAMKRVLRRVRPLFDTWLGNYMDDLPYIDALSIACYCQANLTMAFSAYVLARQMKLRGLLLDKPDLVRTAQFRLDEQRKGVGLPTAEEEIVQSLDDLAWELDRLAEEG